MELKKACRTQAKIRMCIQGPSGAGKTIGALRIAYGLCSDWSKVGIIDTENYSASLYAHLGGFNVLNLSEPFSPERYVQAIKLCEQKGMEVIVIDSISHEWEGIGGIIDTHSKMQGNSFTNWAKVTPRHQVFIQAMLQSSAHVVATIRAKQDYVLVEKNGKQVPEKVGLKGIARENTDYEMTLVLNLDMNHTATTSKDRTGLFVDKPAFPLDAEIGGQIRRWCEEGDYLIDEVGTLKAKIGACVSLADLGKLYSEFPMYQQSLGYLFSERKRELMALQNLQSIIHPQIVQNGIGNH